jgi:hypothetical protein
MVLIMALGLTACGGGGGGGTPDDEGDDGGATGLSGNYREIAFTHSGTLATASLNNAVPGSTGTSGLIAFTQTFLNAQGSISTGGTSSAQFAVAADGTTTFTTTSAGQFPPFQQGGLTTDGEVLLTTNVSAASTPSFIVMGREQSSVATTTIQGAYATCTFAAPMAEGLAEWTTTTFDGAGNWSNPPVDMNLAGVFSTASSGDSGTYAVSSDGTMTTTGGMGPMRGSVFYTGELVVLGGIDGDTMPPRIQVSVRKGTGTSLATFSGAYWFVGIRTDEATGASTSTVGTATADGAGNLTYSAALENGSGSITTGLAGTDTYTVDGNGNLTLTTGLRAGGISASGRVAVVAGETVSGNDPTLILLVRK